MERVFTVGILKSETLFKIFNCYGHTVLTLDAHIKVLTTGSQDESLRRALHIDKGKRVIKLLNVDFLNWQDAGGMELRWPGRVREFVMMVTRAFNGDIHKTIVAFETSEYLEFENRNVQEILNSTLNSTIWLSCRFTVPNLDALRRVRLARIEHMWLRVEQTCTTFHDGGLEIFADWLNRRSILCLRLLFPQEMKEDVVIPAFKAIYKRKWVCIELVAFPRLNHATAHHVLPLFDPAASWKMTYRGPKSRFICPIFIFDDRTGSIFDFIDLSAFDNVSPEPEPTPDNEPTVIEVKRCNDHDNNNEKDQQSPPPVSEDPPKKSQLIQSEIQTQNDDDGLLNLYGHQITENLFTDELDQSGYSLDAGDGIQPTNDVKLDIDLPLFEELTRTEPSIDDFLT